MAYKANTIEVDPNDLIVIRTSDRMAFKRCRRLWGWTSHLRMGLRIREEADYFWFGSGIHFALEDYHGYNVYGHPGKAFLAYVEATRKAGRAPATWNDLTPVGVGMASYYADFWLQSSGRDPLETLTIDGVPQVEVNGFIDLGIKWQNKRVVYGFTLDRLTVDADGGIWVVEYKTAKAFQVLHFDTDEQCTAYCWAGSKMYGLPVQGVWYYQLKKVVPALPRILSTGKISTDPKQQTSSALYRKMLIDIYGSPDAAPVPNRKFHDTLVVEETEDQDRFIRRECVERNPTQLQSFEQRVHLELGEMLNESLPLYPNQTRDCSWQCPLQAACVALEDGSDYDSALSSYAMKPSQSEAESMTWRKLLPNPHHVQLPPEAQLYQELMQEVQQQEQNPQQLLTPEEAFLQELG